MPEVAIFSISLAGETLISSTADPTDIADYENAHEFGPTGLSEEADRTARRFVAVITGEGGANYVAGLVVNYVKVTYTPASYDED